jgi:hypothetical protein
MFDRDHWLLLPEDAIVQQYFDSLTLAGGMYYADRASFPDIPVCFLIMT